MSALPPEQMRALCEAAKTTTHDAEDPGERWQGLQDTSQRIAKLAEITPDQADLSPQAFSVALAEVEAWQRELALQTLDDVEALTKSGLQALSVLAERQAATAVPALALWREVYAAREAIVSLLTQQRAAA